MSSIATVRPPLPPFTLESAIEKVRLAEDGWNTRDAAKVALAYSLDTQWRNRAEFVSNREKAQEFLERKWKKIPQPHRRDDRLGLGVLDIPALRSNHHRGQGTTVSPSRRDRTVNCFFLGSLQEKFHVSTEH